MVSSHPDSSVGPEIGIPYPTPSALPLPTLDESTTAPAITNTKLTVLLNLNHPPPGAHELRRQISLTHGHRSRYICIKNFINGRLKPAGLELVLGIRFLDASTGLFNFLISAGAAGPANVTSKAPWLDESDIGRDAFEICLVNGSASWTETVSVTGAGSVTGSGSGHDLGLLWGGYLSAKAAWQLSERWSVEGSAQFQALGSYEHNYGGRVVELDLSRSLFITIGAGYRF